MNAFRAWTPEDVEGCLALFDSNVPDFFSTDERDEFRSFLADLPGPYSVLPDPRLGLIACGGYAVNPDGRADLCWGMVHRGHHGRGLGKALAEHRIEAATSDPAVSELALNTSQHTVGFYERLGFSVIEIVPDGYAPGLDRCEMRRAVRPG